MDLFEAFPSLNTLQHNSLVGRELRLISISGFVYDEQALYFEISPPRYWGRLPDGKAAIGVGLPKIKPDGLNPPHQSLVQYLRNQWRCHATLYPPGYAIIIDENDNVSLHSDTYNPFMIHMTRPRLGGVNVPDALVQAVYLLPVRRFNWQKANTKTDLLKVNREGIAEFFEHEVWECEDLISRSWSELKVVKSLPSDAVFRTVLTLRRLRNLLRNDQIQLDFFNTEFLN